MSLVNVCRRIDHPFRKHNRTYLPIPFLKGNQLINSNQIKSYKICVANSDLFVAKKKKQQKQKVRRKKTRKHNYELNSKPICSFLQT